MISRFWLKALTAGMGVALLAGAADPVAARQRQQSGRRAADVEMRQAARAMFQREPRDPLFAVVSLADQWASFYDAEGLWARMRVSTGVRTHPTPTGLFVILEKERWHRSNLYYGAPMPFMQRLSWTGVALHHGLVTGRPASHGCIRLRREAARRLFEVTKIGQRVVISPVDVEPVEISHPRLPVPRLQPPPAGAVEVWSRGEGGAGDRPPLQQATNVPTGGTVDAPAASFSDAATGEASELLVNPVQFARALSAVSQDKAASAVRAEKAAALRLARASRALRASSAGRRDSSPDGMGQTDSAQTVELEAAASALQAARDARRAATASQAEAARRLEPLSLFVSRKTGRLYARQGFQRLFETPVTIRDADRPLGTHLFIARRATANGAALQWAALTVPAVTSWGDSRPPRRLARQEGLGPAQPAAADVGSAADALDRIDFPPEAGRRIAELAWVGATLIVSDLGMSGEGKFAMDFQILTHARRP